MGVFARLFRRSKATEEATAAEESTAAATAGSVVTEPAAPEASVETDGTAETDGPAEDGTPETATVREASKQDGDGAENAAADGLDIPRQQSTDEVAEHAAGEGART
ncbi:hypothetical protein GCM10010524_15690 [Streptomyces mexicanus]